MEGVVVQYSTTIPQAVSNESKILSKLQSGNTKRAVKMMCNLQNPSMRVIRGLRGVNNMVNRSHDSHSTAVATATSASQILANPMFEGLTESAEKVIKFAQAEARRLGYNFVGPEMILLGLFGDDIYYGGDQVTDKTSRLLNSMGIYLEDALVEVQEVIGIGNFNGFLSIELPFTRPAKDALALSLQEAWQLGHDYIGPEHLLLGLLGVGGGVNTVLRKLGASADDIRTLVMRMVGERAEVASGGRFNNKITKLKIPVLEEYGINLTELADKEKLDPVVGREPIIKRVIQILGRLRKNNACLVGQRGVGKTTIAQGLAQRIIADFDIPDYRQKKVISLDMRRLVQGRCEERVKKLMEEIKQSGEIVLFIEDIHTLFGAGASEGDVDVANILKQALVRGELQCIGATTPDEYHKHMERDPTFERIFQPVKVPQATLNETIRILMGLRKSYEDHHKVRYTHEALVAAAYMSYQCISDRFLPGKAIDLIDEAGSFVRGKPLVLGVGRTYSELLKELEQVTKLRLRTRETIRACQDKGLGKVHMLLDKEMAYEIHISQIEEIIRETKNSIEVGPIVTKADITAIVPSCNLYI